MNEPIESVLHGSAYLKMAQLQDAVAQIIAKSINAVFHGGTAIWRCYDSGRFSEDVDLYVRKQSDVKKLVNTIALSGLRIVFNRERHGTIYYDVFGNEANISLQMKIAKKRGVLVFYEKVDGVKIQIYSLTPENLIIEKIAAYTDRKLIRDIYDIVVLTRFASDKFLIVGQLKAFISKIERPKDASVLKNLVYSGLAPSFNSMVEYLRRWCTA